MRVFMCVRAADCNIASKETELRQLLETLRIKAEIIVLEWDSLASMIEAAGEGEADQKSEFSYYRKHIRSVR